MMRGKAYFTPWQEDVDPPDGWGDEDFAEMRRRLQEDDYRESKKKSQHGRWDERDEEILYGKRGRHYDAQWNTVAGASANLMGLPGYKLPLGVTEENRGVAERLVDVIAEGKPAGKPIYHGFNDTQGIEWKAGDTITLPLTAATSDADKAMSYGVSYNREDNSGATVFAFPAETPIAGASRWEAVTAGQFEVVGFDTGREGGHRGLPVKVIKLAARAVYDRTRKRWTKL